MKTITSIQNEEIKKVAQLGDTQHRKEQKKFIVEGTRALQTFIDAGIQPVQCYVTDAMLMHAQSIMRDDLITVVNDQVMNKISQTTTPSGIVAVFNIPEQKSLLELSSGIVLADISDPGNMGTLIRTCAAMGKKSVVIINGADVWSPKVVQASAGTLALVTIFNCSFDELVKYKRSIELWALVVQGGIQPKPIGKENVLIMIGNEARGIPQEWVEQCDKKVTLTMPGKAESLNAAIAGSIAMYLAWT
jgi:TrmH family RNA methyltransferase